MMFLNSLTNWLRKRTPTDKTPQRRSARLRLEELEDRVVPAFVPTYTNASIQITPGFTVTEKVTVSVTPFGSFSSSTGVTTPPATNTPPAGGTVLVGLNNMQQSATLGNNGQATATFQVPLLAFLTSQTLRVSFLGFKNTSTGNTYESSNNNLPVYKNFDNVLLPATISFAIPTPQQFQATFQTVAPFNQLSLQAFGSVAGEKDDFGLFSYNYVDPGNIDTVTALGRQFPGILAARLGAYNGLNITIGT